MTKPTMPNRYGEELESPPPAPEELVKELTASGITFDVGGAERAEHARDWWPRLIPGVKNGHVERWPSVVVMARSSADVVATMRIAQRLRIPVTPQGGRSGVVGGAVPEVGGIALDLTGLDQIIELDEISHTVTAQAGVFGPDLELFVRTRGFTVGHFPQSFDLATIGGWLACRGAGQYSNRYGKIEDMVRGLNVVLANGETLQLGGVGPKQAVGPDLLQLFVGSEGTLGIITEATLVVHALATNEARSAFSFESFEEGMQACRRIMQREAHPAVLRLHDEIESKRNFDVEHCVLIVLDEGDPLFVDATMHVVNEECSSAHRLDEALVERWLSHRNDVSALAPLWERGLVVDTIEVSGPWSVLEKLHQSVTGTLQAIEGMILASVHQSHAYIDGACLYFTFAGQPDGDTTAFYKNAWDTAISEVITNGGAISHHHGIGRNRARFVAEAMGSSFVVLEGLKSQLDPHNLMNPGVLGLGGPSW